MKRAVGDPLRVLLFSTLYPSSERPGHGLFIETRLQKLLATSQVQAKVLAPVPWFFSTDAKHGERARMARTPHRETWHGVDVLHPRYLLPPRIGQTVAPGVLALGALRALRALQRDGFDFDLIDAHYFYPDGVAAALLARWSGKPLVVSARGSDINVLGLHPVARRMMCWAMRQAQASIAVSQALAKIMVKWGADAQRLHVMRNGVDLLRFVSNDKKSARLALDCAGTPMLLSVGNLVLLKGHDRTIEALAVLKATHPLARLYIAGEGPDRAALQALAQSRGVADSVILLGRIANEELAPWYSAADVFVLASRSEGWANVLLESMACGTPVVATPVGSAAELIGSSGAGVLVDETAREPLVSALMQLLKMAPDRAVVRQHAQGFGWEETTQAQLALFRQLTNLEGVRRAQAPL